MPQFEINLGYGGTRWRRLDSFTQGYIEAAFFTSTGPDNEQEGLGAGAAFDEIAPEALTAIEADCRQWQEQNAGLLEQAYARDYDATQAGRDYWFTRNGHGVGFWDRKALEPDSAEYEALTAAMVAARNNSPAWDAALAKRDALSAESIGEKLAAACRRKEVNMYRGDDNLIYFT